MRDWLNGWYYNEGATILVGSMVHCVGCGKQYGVTCVVIDASYTFPDKAPEWPFSVDNCPICQLAAKIPWGNDEKQDKLVARMKIKEQLTHANAELEKERRKSQLMYVVLGVISCHTQDDGLLWWQLAAREARKQCADIDAGGEGGNG